VRLSHHDITDRAALLGFHDIDYGEHAAAVSFATTGPGAFIDGPRCGLAARWLRVVTRALDVKGLTTIQPVLYALDTAVQVSVSTTAKRSTPISSAAGSAWPRRRHRRGILKSRKHRA
jgi:hypothetical protein